MPFIGVGRWAGEVWVDGSDLRLWTVKAGGFGCKDCSLGVELWVALGGWDLVAAGCGSDLARCGYCGACGCDVTELSCDDGAGIGGGCGGG